MTSIMSPLAAAAANPNDSNSTPSANNNNLINGNEFMTLLTAELKNQDPTSPMDPTQFVSQLVQFNSLEQLTSINQELAPTSSSATTPGAPAAS